MAASNEMGFVPGEMDWRTLVQKVIIRQWVFYAFLEMQSGVRRGGQALSAGRAPVAWVGLTGTTAVSLGAVCRQWPWLAPSL